MSRTAFGLKSRATGWRSVPGNAAYLALGSDSRLLEVCNHLSIAVWGAWLLMPWATPQATAFHLLSEFGDVSLWGLAGVLTGALGVCGLFVDSRIKRKAATALAFLFWLLITVSVATGSGTGSTGVPIYGLRALFALLAYSRVANPRSDGESEVPRV